MLSLARGLLLIVGVIAVLAKWTGLLPTLTWMQVWVPIMAWAALFIIALMPIIIAFVAAIFAAMGAALFPGKHNFR